MAAKAAIHARFNAHGVGGVAHACFALRLATRKEVFQAISRNISTPATVTKIPINSSAVSRSLK